MTFLFIYLCAHLDEPLRKPGLSLPTDEQYKVDLRNMLRNRLWECKEVNLNNKNNSLPFCDALKMIE